MGAGEEDAEHLVTTSITKVASENLEGGAVEAVDAKRGPGFAILAVDLTI
jgi:hypothetical protein